MFSTWAITRRGLSAASSAFFHQKYFRASVRSNESASASITIEVLRAPRRSLGSYVRPPIYGSFAKALRCGSGIVKAVSTSTAEALSECPIVIVTHNRAQILRRTLERLYDLPERVPLLVVDNASTDDTEVVCKAFGSRLQLLKLRRNIGAAARTIGAREAASPFVAFCDDDCTWEGGSLQRAVEIFHRHAEVAVLNGRILVGDGERPDPACEAMRGDPSLTRTLPGVPIVYFMAGASVMRRAPFLEAGGYHIRYFIGAEESLLSLDLAARGWKLWYCDDLVVRHYPAHANRDPERRRRLVLRNQLWTALLRRPAANALRMLGQYANMACRDRVARAALREAIAGLPWVLRERRPIPPELERRVSALDNALTR